MLVTVTVRVKAALRVQSRLYRLPPHHHIHISFYATMGRQQTLGKFFGKTGDPPVQTKLDDASGMKRKRVSKPESKADKKVDDEKIDEQGKSTRSPSPAKNGKVQDKLTTIDVYCGESVKEKFPAAKRRRVVESDDEDAPEPGPSTVKKPQCLAPETQPSKVVTDGSSVLTKAKAKNPEPAAEDEPMDEDEAATSSSHEDDADEGEEEIDADEELEEEEDTATTNAEAALSRTQEVDIPGGWKVGDPVPYAALAKVFSLIEATTKRIEKTSLLTSFLLLVIRRRAKADTQSLLQAVYLCINRLCPDYVGIELGIGESLLIKAISESTGRSMAIVKADLKKEGDLGLVAMNSKNSQKTLFKPKPLTLPVVFKNLKEIALSSGHSSQNKKVSIITKLLASCQGQEAKYIVRSLEGKLRIGNAERTVLVALAHATVLAEQESSNKRLSKDKLAARLEEATNVIKQVYSELPSYDLVIPALLNVGIDKLRNECKLTPGVPLKPMLAKPTKAIGEVLDKFEGKKFTCEYKYDGERAQVHKLEDGTIAVFSRNSEDMSKKYPDLMEQLPRCVKEGTKTFVFDAEAVAIDKDSAKLLPFQELSRRKRKDVKVEDIKVRVCLFAFDLLYLNGEPLLQKDFTERRELLKEHFQPVDLEFQFAKASDAHATDDIQSFLEESVKDGCEGLMVKMLEGELSHYEPSRRTVNWLKLKKDYLAGVGDSLDLVVVGGYYGKGKRTNVYGAFLLACYDSDSEEYQTICKIGTGFSDEALQAHYESLKPLEMQTPRGDIKIGGAKPDVWFEPKVVWEVLTADLSLSPIYTAAQGLVEERGISLRFPRFIRIRDDKSADDATGPEQIAEMYQRQALAQTKGGKKGRGGDADDGFW
ncbi:ATP-dependent DNA ligase [Lentinus tigrinus ALCF2SS1-6]|uniref:DNA ligase n=1 Tax=Lentinus tigrinus ALCF2SS1-6 TaxID=1328759 RepID=A0A5C2SN46_9APHY|nr:ATP-dependent DNA ligase [Lentinus tigrinus ALCF2SS1-6]